MCPDVKGEPVLDVSLRCGSSPDKDQGSHKCKATVLYQQGRTLSTCPLVEQTAEDEQSKLHTATSISSEASLIEVGSDMNSAFEPEERVLSLAKCSKSIYQSGDEGCSFVSTNG